MPSNPENLTRHFTQLLPTLPVMIQLNFIAYFPHTWKRNTHARTHTHTRRNGLGISTSLLIDHQSLKRSHALVGEGLTCNWPAKQSNEAKNKLKDIDCGRTRYIIVWNCVITQIRSFCPTSFYKHHLEVLIVNKHQ